MERDENMALLACPRVQGEVMKSIIFHEHTIAHSPSSRYIVQFLKKYIAIIESVPNYDLDDELIEFYVSLATTTDMSAGAGGMCYKTYALDKEQYSKVVLMEEQMMISHGTTGLQTWEASLRLADFFIEHPDPALGGKIEVAELDWEHTTECSNLSSTADVVIGADITYDPTLVPILVSALKAMVSTSQQVAYITATIRNQETFDLFLQLIAPFGSATVSDFPDIGAHQPPLRRASSLMSAEDSHDAQLHLIRRSNGALRPCESNNATNAAAPTTGRKRGYSEVASGTHESMDVDMLARRRYPSFGGKCYRHSAQVYLAESNNTQRELQSLLLALPAGEQSKVSGIWRDFASETAERRLLILQGIVNLCCIPQLSYLNKVVPQQLRVDFLGAAPPDVSLKILSYLDARSLCQATQVSRTWAALANDDILWHRMCAQHIDKVCKKCGWGLPLLDKSGRRMYEATARRALQLASNHATGEAQGVSVSRTQSHGAAAEASSTFSLAASASGEPYTFALRTANVTIEPAQASNELPPYQLRNRQVIPISALVNPADMDVSLISSVCSPQSSVPFMPDSRQQQPPLHVQNFAGSSMSGSQPHISRYLRSQNAANGNLSDSSSSTDGGNGNDNVGDVGGHATTNGINNSNGKEIGNNHGLLASRPRRRPWKAIFAERQIIANNWRKFRYQESHVQAHADGILCVQFNDEYMITGSYDSKVHVWDAETLELVSELTGHTMPVRALEFDDCKLFSGSLDGTVKIWNYRDGTCIRTLRVFENGGVISLYHQKGTLVVGGENGTIQVYNIAKMTSFTLTGHTDWVNAVRLYGENTLFSCSDDMLIKRWDLEERRCMRTYSGHTHHVQSLQLSTKTSSATPINGNLAPLRPRARQSLPKDGDEESKPFMISGSLDSTMRVWDIETGECVDTIFGHVEGIWSMAFDSLRVVSGSNDGIVKVWDTSSHACLFTLQASAAAINCVAISDTRIVVGDNEGSARIYDFRDRGSLESAS
ncbi:ubiquitin-binding SDF ubiquitin ligase complex subunit met30 [Coemansia sp. RSA 2320]|nr:ubiquitin-binding SDF ubiquitin ligase complex subunit met30 [Coemansia sp. RSA 2320]